MEATSFESGCPHSSLNFLHQIDSEYGRYSSLSQSESCPSLSSSFLTIDTSALSVDSGRRESIGSTSPDNFTITSTRVPSPITPIGTMSMRNFFESDTWPRSQPEDMWYQNNAESDASWLAPEGPTMANCVMNSFPDQNAIAQFQFGYFCLTPRPKSAADPPISRAVFRHAIQGQPSHVVDNMLPWSNQNIMAHPQTVEPSATFQAALSSSPLKFEPITPLRHHRVSSSVFASSPLSGTLSSMLPSQWDVEESKYSPASEYEVYPESEATPQVLCSPREPRVKREESTSLKTPSSKSGVNCEAIIPVNVHACSFPGCVDKQGRQKRFKRQEHKKRHERSVHGGAGGGFACWVQTGGKKCGRVFSRRDNYRSHLIKTHGRRSNNQRNAYVATLDKNSPYADEDWQGPLTADGLPVGHPKFPEIQ